MHPKPNLPRRSQPPNMYSATHRPSTDPTWSYCPYQTGSNPTQYSFYIREYVRRFSTRPQLQHNIRLNIILAIRDTAQYVSLRVLRCPQRVSANSGHSSLQTGLKTIQYKFYIRKYVRRFSTTRSNFNLKCIANTIQRFGTTLVQDSTCSTWSNPCGPQLRTKPVRSTDPPRTKKGRQDRRALTKCYPALQPHPTEESQRQFPPRAPKRQLRNKTTYLIHTYVLIASVSVAILLYLICIFP